MQPSIQEIRKQLTQGPVHERRLEMYSYPVTEDGLLVEGVLRDDRYTRAYTWSGAVRPPGPVHDMTLRMFVRGWPLTIEAAEAEMRHVPYSECKAVSETAEKLVGIRITSGYSEAVRRRIGGVAGCIHLLHLALAMGPAALHGDFARRVQQPMELPETLEAFPGLETLVNSCRLWRKDGPIIDDLRKAIEAGRESGAGPASETQ
jgi:hypothetical protein